MIAGAYLRKSTAQEGVADDDKSVKFQREHVKTFAAKRGWLLPDEYIFEDDGKSGAEFARRPGYVRLMGSLKPRPPFGALIMYDETRLGREQIETSYALKQIVQAGVEVWFSKDERRRTLDSPVDKFMLSALNFAAEEQRVTTAERTRSTMERKAGLGHVTGGCVFGYANLRITVNGHRGHVERQIVPAEAEAVRWIFERIAEGSGYRNTAHAANEAGLPTPKPRRKNDDGTPAAAGWSPSTVRDLVNRDLYRGVNVWGKRKKRDTWGQKRPTLRPKDDWQIKEAEGLRIVSDDLWARAHERLQTSRESYVRTNDGKLFGKPGNSVESKYLLTGLATCGVCGGALTARSSKRHPWAYYCLSNIQRGASVCPNTAHAPLHGLDDVVLTMFESQLLDSDTIQAAVKAAAENLTRDTGDGTERAALLARAKKIEAEITNLTTAIATAAGPLPALVAALQEREAERARLTADLRQCDLLEQARTLDVRQIEAELNGRLMDWRGLLRANVQQARQVLRKLMVGRLAVTPNQDRNEFRITGTGLIEPLLEHTLSVPKALVTPAGFEPAISTLKGSCGRLQ
jgi:site-specific DNA recombinase